MPSLFDLNSIDQTAACQAANRTCTEPAIQRGGLDEPLAPSPFSVRRQRAFRQFQSACGDLLTDARQRARDPLDGLHTSMQCLLAGKTKPAIRFSDLADYEDDQNTVVRCKEIATEILQSIYPISSTLDGAAESAALHRAIQPTSLLPTRLRDPGHRIGYRVHISRLLTAVTELEAIVADRGLAAPISAVPLGLSRIVTDRLLTFQPHLSARNMGMYLVVTHQARDLSDYTAQASWDVTCQAPIERLSAAFC